MDSTTAPRCKVAFHSSDCCSLASLLQSKLASPDSVCLVSDNARRPSDSLLEQALLVMKDFDMGLGEDDDCEDHYAAKTEECSSDQLHAPQTSATTSTTLSRRRRPLRSQKVGKKQVKASSKRFGVVQSHEKEQLAVSDLPALVTQTCALASPPPSSLQQRRKLIEVLESTRLLSENPLALRDPNVRVRWSRLSKSLSSFH